MSDFDQSKHEEACNASDISKLINRQLNPKGIYARTQIKNDCLQVLLESQELRNEVALKKITQNLLINQNLGKIHKVKVYGRRKGDKNLAWQDEFDIPEKASNTLVELPAQAATTQSDPPTKPVPTSARTLEAKTAKGKTAFSRKEALRKHFPLIVLTTVSLGFATWLVTTEGYQNTLKEVSREQIISSLFGSTSNASHDSDVVTENSQAYIELAERLVDTHEEDYLYKQKYPAIYGSPPYSSFSRDELIKDYENSLVKMDTVCAENEEQIVVALLSARSRLIERSAFVPIESLTTAITLGLPTNNNYIEGAADCGAFLDFIVANEQPKS